MNEPLSVRDYKIMQRAEILSDGELHGVLNRNGAANWTCCPLCHVDDFTHVQGCELIPGSRKR